MISRIQLELSAALAALILVVAPGLVGADLDVDARIEHRLVPRVLAVVPQRPQR